MDPPDALYPEDLEIAKDALSGDEASAGVFVLPAGHRTVPGQAVRWACDVDPEVDRHCR